MNRFEGRSNYHHYYPTDDMDEQKIEKMWYLAQNKLVADKRRDEELKQSLRDWSHARARIEVEVQRKQEHQKSGSKFVESRGYCRSYNKSKNFNHKDNPLLNNSSSSEDEDAILLSPLSKYQKGPEVPLVVLEDGESLLSPE